MLSVRSFNAPFTFPFCISSTNFWKSEPLFSILSLTSNFFESSDSPEVIPIGHLIAKVPSYVQVLSDGLLIYSPLRVFCRSELGIIITLFIAIFFRGESSIHALNSFVNSSMNNLPAFPVGRRNRLFFQ